MSTLPPIQYLESIQRRAMAAAGVAAMAAGCGVVAMINPTETHLFPVCPLYALTGLACPGCGLTRAFHALFTGDVVTALDYNALIPVWAVNFLWVFFISLIVF